MNKFKKIIAVLLSMLVLLTVSPIAAFAEEAAPEAAWFNSIGIRKGDGTLSDAVKNVTANGRIEILRDITDVSAPVTLNRNIIINGNGYSIERAENYAAVMLFVEDNATVTLNDVTISGNSDNFIGYANSLISITSGKLVLNSGTKLTKNVANFSNGAAINAEGISAVNKAIVVMNPGSEISYCAGNDGGAVYLGNYAEMSVADASINNCTALYDGGAVSVDAPTAVFTMTSGSITDCAASTRDIGYAGSAIYAGNGTVEITGGKITGNTNRADRGALYISSASNVTIGNSAYIFGNDGNVSDSNIYIANNAVLNITPSLVDGARCGISTTAQLKEGDTVDMSIINCKDDLTGKLFNDFDGSTFYKQGNNVTLAKCIIVTFDPGNGTCPVESKIYIVGLSYGELPRCNARDGFDFLGWYTANDELISETTVVTEVEDITLFAKWENLNQLDTSPLSVIGRFFERIGELMRSVFKFLENLFTGNGNNEIENI